MNNVTGLSALVLPKEVKSALFLSFGMFVTYMLLVGIGVLGDNELTYGDLYRQGVLPIFVGAYLFYFVLLFVFSGIASWSRVILAIAVGGVFGLLYFLVFPYSGPAESGSTAQFGVMLSGIGVSSLLFLILGLRGADLEKRIVILRLLAMGLLILVMALSGSGMLKLTTLLHPATFDAILFHFDQVLGGQISVVLAVFMERHAWLEIVVRKAYSYLPLGFAILYALQFRYPERRYVNLLGLWIQLMVGVIIVYHIIPVSGPRYLFGADFPHNIPPLESIPDFQVVIPPSVRNGVPSMHFGWAFALWLASTWLRPFWIRAGFAILLALNIFATLATGEHYLLDLIVAIPFVLAVYALCLNGISRALARRIALQNFLVFAVWLALLRFGLSLVQTVPWLLWGAIVSTLLLAFVVVRRLAASNGDEAFESQGVTSVQEIKLSRELWLIAGLFVFSGFSGLVYEVVFAKSLALAFGSTAVATYTVLAVYMGGMSIGAWLGGWLQERLDRPLVGYAGCEVFIGLYCALTPLIFSWMQSIYVGIAGGSDPSSQSLLFFRLGLGAVVLLVPTVLMGMTMPLLVRYFSDRKEQLGVSVALLYSTNTLGAALGALLTGYFVIPVLGIKSTTFLAAGLNLLVAMLAIKIYLRFDAKNTNVLVSRSKEYIASNAFVPPSLGWVGLVVLLVGGAITLALETSYIHLLAVVAGNSAYAFSLMLFTFLLGLSCGAVGAKRLLALSWPLAELLAWLEFGLALVILLGVYSWEIIPGYFGDYARYSKPLSFSEREFIRGFVCWLAMFPPAILIGAIYPVAMDCVGRAFPVRKVRMLGYAMALNTAGNIAGVLVCGFLLLPMLGALTSIHILAGVAIALAITAALAGKPKSKLWAISPLPIVLLVFWWQPTEFNYSELASGTNVYFAPQNRGEAIDHSESLDGGLTTVAVVTGEDGKSVKTLLTNGKFQGNDAEQGEVKAQIGFALAPLLHTAKRESALVIGYGTGMSAHTLHEAGFRSMDIVELSGDIMRVADQYFGNINKGVSKASGVTVHITDGRNYLLLNQSTYDLVSMEISSIWFAGAASLYNQEFYRLVRHRLNEDGVLQQWIQLHHLRTLDLVSILATLRSEFKYVWLYYIGGQGILVASNSEKTAMSAQNAEVLNNSKSLQPLVSIVGGNAGLLMDALIASPDAIDRLVEFPDIPSNLLISTDNNLYLEYGTPYGNALKMSYSLESNLDFLRSFRK